MSGILGSITLSAETTALAAGEAVQLTATGHLVGGGDVNLTQEVEYASSTPGVAAEDNPPGDRSRIVGVAAGTAVISARDPGTGVVTTAAGGLTLTVTAP